MKRVILMGCGALGTVFAVNFNEVLSEHYRLAGVFDVDPGRAAVLAAEVAGNCHTYASDRKSVV